ncbi:hypothetical protein [Streptomyces sp. NBC_01212]|uniref:hypothetical protein n=1 Tax=Streptomyces sp. NBC_01212 TaxID=2903775 RepID=UPI002E14D981|nr:hypothetical protein OG722_23705 [Streptomyces sp. NBC_01212]
MDEPAHRNHRTGTSMARDIEADSYLCGRLYAALAELQRLGTGEHHSLGRQETLRKLAKEPSKHLIDHLHKAGKYLVDAGRRGQGSPAATVFRSLPDLLPTGRELPGCLRDASLQERFQAGITAQRAEIAKAV